MKNGSSRKRQRGGREKYPCVIFKVPSDHHSYRLGWRFHVHDIDDDILWFHHVDRMLFVLDCHAMLAVSADEMEAIRKARQQGVV